MRFVKAIERLPISYWTGPVRFGQKVDNWVYGTRTGVSLSQDLRRYPDIEWLDESLPASIEQEAERLYPEPTGRRERPYSEHEIVDIQRDVHITCARQYMGEIEKLRAENERLSESLDDTQKFLAAAERGAGFQQKQITELLEERDALVVIMEQIAAIASSKTKEA